MRLQYTALALPVPRTCKSTLGAMLLLEPPAQFPGPATYPPGSEWSGSGIDID
jgi:hypothetical protein